MKNIYLFTGNEELIIKNKIENTIKNIDASSMNISSYNLEEVNIATVIEDAMTPPFLSPSKIIILKRPIFLSSSKTEINHNVNLFSNYLNNPCETTFLLIDATGIKLDEKKDYVKKLIKVCEVSETKDLSPIEAEGWLKRQLSIEGIEIRDDAIKAFFSRTGRNLLDCKKEAEKLTLYVKPRNVATIKDVNDVVTKEIEQDAFALTNAIIDKNNSQVISIYHQLLESGKDVMQLIGLISKSFIDILVVGKLVNRGMKQADITNVLGMSSGRVFHLMKNAKNFSEEDVSDYIIRLAELDAKIKSGRIDPQSGMELFLFGLKV